MAEGSSQISESCIVSYETERNVHSKNDVLKVVEVDLDLQIVYAKFRNKEELNGSDQVIIAKSLLKYILIQNVTRE